LAQIAIVVNIKHKLLSAEHFYDSCVFGDVPFVTGEGVLCGVSDSRVKNGALG
jgi:hypothetical protein